MTATQQLKAPIRTWLQRYSDERLAALEAHCSDGKLSFWGCCCLIGSLTATHALRCAPVQRVTFLGATILEWQRHGTEGCAQHYRQARQIPGAFEAEMAYKRLGYGPRNWKKQDAKRRRVLLPMIRAEVKRRAVWRREQQEVKHAAV